MNSNLLGMLGLCRRAGMLQAGDEPAEAACRAKDARVLLLASDAADNTARRVLHFSQAGACLWLRVPFTKAEMGRAVGRASCAIIAVTDIGFASSMVRRLADADPDQYGEAAAKLELKAQRAAERRMEQKAHEKNLREGLRQKETPPEGRKAPPSRPAPAAAKSGAPRTAGSRTGSPRRPSGTPRTPGKPGSFGRPQAPGSRTGNRPLRSERRPTGSAASFAHSRPVKKGKGSFRKKEGS